MSYFFHEAARVEHLAYYEERLRELGAGGRS